MYYLDANSSATLRPEVALALIDVIQRSPAATNASNIHRNGQLARRLLTDSRDSLLQVLNLDRNETQIVFLSGGTEACASAVHGYLEGAVPSHTHLVSSSIEHAAMLESLRAWERRGATLTLVAPDSTGKISVEQFVAAVQPNTQLVSLMAANNETGVIQPVLEVVKGLRAKHYAGPIVVDFTQALNKSPLQLSALFDAGVNAAILSAHKIGAPTGVGALVINTRPTSLCFQFTPLLRGGAQEYGFRAGTENLLGIVGFGVAARKIASDGVAEQDAIFEAREKLSQELLMRAPWIERITPTSREHGLVNTLFIRTPGVRGDDAVVALDLAGVSCSTGAACSSGKQSVSHVVEAMGFTGAMGREFLRLSLDWQFSLNDCVGAAGIIADVLDRIREIDAEQTQLQNSFPGNAAA